MHGVFFLKKGLLTLGALMRVVRMKILKVSLLTLFPQCLESPFCVYDVVKRLTSMRYLVGKMSSSSELTVVNRFNVKQCPCLPTKLRRHQMFNYLFSYITVILVDICAALL